MSDIAFLLIIFFAVAGKFVTSSEKDVILPGVDLGNTNPKRDIEVVVTESGQYFVNGSRVEADGLAEEIGSYIMEDSDVAARTVVLHADRDAEYGQVAHAIEAVNQADAYLELAVRHTD